ncbi:hypothetical protein MPSEU_000674600 [Mayamaea pseudoterrestris]|nr:hypothetical protein MPSEU_000674600 [Mayamaea pseudoterrestris]
MFRSSLLLLTVLIASCTTRYADAAAFLSTTVTCAEVDFEGEDNDPIVCATYGGTTPSPAMLENGTTVYLGPNTYDFFFYNGLENGTDVSTLDNAADYETNVSVSVSWENVGNCTVLVNNEECRACSLCLDDDNDMQELSADCSNLPDGRSVECEDVFIFYPLSTLPQAAAGGATSAPAAGGATSAPAAAPTTAAADTDDANSEDSILDDNAATSGAAITKRLGGLLLLSVVSLLQ